MDSDSCYIPDALEHQATDHANGEPPSVIVYAQSELWQNHHAEEDGEKDVAVITWSVEKMRLCQATGLERAILSGNRKIATDVWVDGHRERGRKAVELRLQRKYGI